MSWLRTAWTDACHPEVLAQADRVSTPARARLQASLDAERQGASQ